MPPPELEETRPKPKPPKHKHKHNPPKPEPNLRMGSEQEKEQTAPDGVPVYPDPFSCVADCSASCAFYRLCPPPPPPPPSSGDAATVHLHSSRLPTPLIALSASLLVVSVVLLIALLVCSLVRRRRMRRRRRQETTPQEAPRTQQDEEGAPVPAVVAEEGEDGGVHHVWYIRTVGLEERAIAAITALVYDAKKCGGGGFGGDGGSCAVCLAEFIDGDTLRLLPRCHHAFHRGCIDTWLRAHVNCPLCRAPVQVADKASAAAGANAATAAAAGQPEANPRPTGAPGINRAEAQGLPERAVRRAASMMTLPRRAWPEVSFREPASNSGRVGEMGLAKISRLIKFSEVLEMAGIGAGRSLSFGSANCLRLPGRSGPSAAAGTNADDISR
ncbi:hypothetical protein GUJ93_ZPchr0011g28726 [Zizania palustris]|uniref:RING-type E3 ubiquitin transferase n=1 Tax=Zizania palustris TaxID=103762 RepID=A0A8J5WI85_ZIZPA|nr:hypothetical protein GUJ93_ZPchr0011g28726 [Zizania palustris]